MKVMLSKVFILIIFMKLIFAPFISAEEANIGTMVFHRLSSFEVCIGINAFLQGQMKKMSEDIDSFKKEDLIKIIELSGNLSDFIEKEINLNPVEDKKLYQGELIRLIRQYKSTSQFLQKPSAPTGLRIDYIQ